jgi:E3 ubiquitin-protein ligase DCST1
MPDYSVLTHKNGRNLKLPEKILNFLRNAFKKRLPLLYKLVTSRSNEFKTAKSILCFLIGTIYGVIIFRCTIANIDELDVKIKLVLGMIILTVISIGMAFEVQMRCIVTLSVLNFLTQAGRVIIIGYIIATITFDKGPIAVGFKNMKSLSQSIICYRTFLINKYVSMYNIKWKPYKDIIVGLITGNKEMLESAKRVNKLIDQLDYDVNEVGKELEKQPTKKAKDTNDHLSFAKNQSLTNNFNEIFEKSKEIQCKGIMETGEEICQNSIKMVIDSCKNIWFMLNSICNLGEHLKFICKFSHRFKIENDKDKDKFCDEESKSQTSAGLDGDISILHKLKGAFNSNLSMSMTYLRSNQQLLKNLPNATFKHHLTNVMLEAQTLEQDLSLAMYYFKLLESVAKVIASYGFFLVFINAFRYNKSYLNDITFDNCYISQYFRHVDARRYKAEKKTVLPIKKLEEVQLVYPTERRLLQWQKNEIRYGILLCTILTSFTIFVIIANFFITDFNRSVRKHGRIIHVQRGEHKIFFQVKGKGFIANLLRKVLKDIHIEETVEKETDTEICMPEEFYLENKELFQFAGYFILLYIMVYSEAYIQRLNRVVCAYFYRRWEKQRILWLYNRTLKNRKLYTKNLIKRAIMRSKGFELEPDTSLIAILVYYLSKKHKFQGFVRFLKVLKIGLGKCILCDQTERIGSIKCDICECLYCYECWLDAKQTCLVCTPSIYEKPDWKFEGNLKFE